MNRIDMFTYLYLLPAADGRYEVADLLQWHNSTWFCHSEWRGRIRNIRYTVSVGWRNPTTGEFGYTSGTLLTLPDT